MSGLVGKGVRSYKKAIVSDSNFPALGFRNFIMAFQAVAGVGAGVPVDLTSALTVPSEMVAAGFEQPDPITIGNAQLGNFRNNVIVTSNLNGILIDRISYTLTNDSITFDDGLNANEIIVIKRGNEAVTGNRIVDARPLRASGTVDFSTIGSSPVIFEVGEGFRIAPSTLATGGIDNRQIGFVQVFADGVLQARNVGNEDESMRPASEQTGNYREVIVDGNGNLLTTQNGVTANAIEFNQFQPFSAEEGVIVISTNLIVDSPNSTGVIDAVDVISARVTAVETDVTANTTELATIPAASSGTDGQLLSTNGSTFVFEDATSGASQQLNLIQALGTRKAVETSGITLPTQQSFTWVVPPGVDNIFVIMAGAGSSGSGQSNGNVAGSGGAFFQDWLRVVPGQTYNIDVGDGSVRSDGANNRHQGGGNTFIQGSATALIDGQASVRIEASGAPGDDSAGTVGNVNFTLGTNTYTVPANLNNIDGGVNTARFFSSNVLGGFLPAFGKLQDSDWNDVMFRTSGSGTSGGDTAIAARVNPSDIGLAQAGGGGGFLQAEQPNINSGFGRASGPGGIRIGWYSNSEFATAHPLVTV